VKGRKGEREKRRKGETEKGRKGETENFAFFAVKEEDEQLNAEQMDFDLRTYNDFLFLYSNVLHS
jgi:hypothetical protein